MKVWLSAVAVAAVCYATPTKLRAEERLSTIREPLPLGVGTPEPLPEGARIDRIVIDKSERRLEAYQGGELLKAYAVALGSGEGNKQREGDRRTPEGEYTIGDRWKSRQFNLFLSVSYPNRDDWRRFRRAKRRGEIPKSARIGGSIGIHGERQTWKDDRPHKLFNWTAGCIALDDDEIEELYAAVEPGAKVIIQP